MYRADPPEVAIQKLRNTFRSNFRSLTPLSRLLHVNHLTTSRIAIPHPFFLLKVLRNLLIARKVLCYLTKSFLGFFTYRLRDALPRYRPD